MEEIIHTIQLRVRKWYANSYRHTGVYDLEVFEKDIYQ